MAPFKGDSLAGGSAAKKKAKKPPRAEPMKIKKKKSTKSGNKKKKSSSDKAAGNAGDDTTLVDDTLVDDKRADRSSIADQSGAAVHKYLPGRVVLAKDMPQSHLTAYQYNPTATPYAKGNTPGSALSAKDKTFVTVEEFDPQEAEKNTSMVKIKQEPVSPTLPKATLFSQKAVAIEDSVADEHYSTPLQLPYPANVGLTKENVPLRSESRVPLPRFPHYEQAKRSASPSPSSQLRNENPSALMTLVNSINTRNEKQSPSKASSTQVIIKATPIPNSTADPYFFPPTSPLNSKTPKPLPNRMLQFESSPKRFSPSKSNKCTPVPLPMIKGFPPAPRLGTPFAAKAGTEEDPFTPADVDNILDSVLSKNNSGDEHGDTKMDDAPAVTNKGVAINEGSNVEMSTIVKEEPHSDPAAEAPLKKTKKSKKNQKRRLEESNALDNDDTITVSTPKKAKKNKKKKTKKVNVQEEQENENTMDLDGMTQVGDESTVLGETTQLEVDKQLQEAMQLAGNTEHGGTASKTVSTPAKDVKESSAEREIKEIITELTSPVKTSPVKKKKKTKKGRRAQKNQVEEVVAPVVDVANPEQTMEVEQVTDVAPVNDIANPEQPMEVEQAIAVTPANKLFPAPEAMSTKKGRKAAMPTTASGIAAAISSDPLLSIAKKFVKFDNNLTYSTEISQAEIAAIRQNLAALDQRIQANELRASIRQEILFNALKKVSMDINKLNAAIAKGGEAQAVADSPDASLGEVARDRLSRSARATAVGPKGSIHSTTPIPLPMFGNTKAVSSAHHRETPTSGARGAGAGAKAAGATGGDAFAEARKNQDKLLAGFTNEMNAAKDAKTVEIKGRLCVKYADDLFKMF